MNKKSAQTLIIYGVFLIVAGLAGYLSNPEKAKTALMSGGTFGLLSIVLGWLGTKQISWSLAVAKITTIFLAIVFTWRSAVTWGKYLDGHSDKLFSAGLISLMLFATIITITGLFKDRKSQ